MCCVLNVLEHSSHDIDIDIDEDFGAKRYYPYLVMDYLPSEK
jgi:hypothetical protein